jgi:uncharacterized protein (DUF58 family)
MQSRFFLTDDLQIPEPKAVRRLQITSSRMATALFAGEYRSAFRGRGIEFDEVREYEAGDDIRSIDWNVTARQGHPFIKRFIEEREFTLFLILDRSSSMDFGTIRASKLDTAIEACALLTFAALRSHDKMALLTYGDGELRYLPPGKGKRHALQLIRMAMFPTVTKQHAANLAEVLDHLRRVVRVRSLMCIFSDFIDPVPYRSLTALAERQDIVAVAVTDPVEHILPDAGLLRLMDPEHGITRLIDSANIKVRKKFYLIAKQRNDQLRAAITATGTALLTLGTQVPPLYPLMHFFRSRFQGHIR